MKYRIGLLMGVAAIFLVLIIQSCSKDESPESNSFGLSNKDMELYDQFGPKLEKSISKAIEISEVKNALIKLTQQRTTGDFEVLVSDFFNYETREGNLIKDLVVESAGESISGNEIEHFLQEYPSLIIAIRGSVLSWSNDEHIPTTVFVPSTFSELSKEIMGTKKGRADKIHLDKKFEDAVVVMHISERHDKYGKLLVNQNNLALKSKSNTDPIVDLTTAKKIDQSNVEPTSCPLLTPVITSFEVENTPNGLKVSYDIDNFDENLYTWGIIEIERIGPPSQPRVTIYRFAHQSNFFYDENITTPNSEYDYFIKAWVRFINPAGINQGDWQNCTESNTMTANVETVAPLPLLNSFVGANFNNEIISYSWYAPNNTQVAEYRLSVKNENNDYEVVEVFDNYTSPTENFEYAYHHEESDRGKKVDMKIEYKNSGQWGGDYKSKVYASYRNPGEPLNFYGLVSPNISSTYEASTVGESLLFGAPELDILAVRGSGDFNNNQTKEESRGICFMENCIRIYINNDGDEIYIPTNTYIPVNGPWAIVSSWDNNLVGTAVTIKVEETDLGSLLPVINQEIETVNKDISAKIGLKFNIFPGAGINASYGKEEKYKNATKTSKVYPAGSVSLPISVLTIYYHDEKIIRNTQGMSALYGLIEDFEIGDQCENLKIHLPENL